MADALHLPLAEPVPERFALLGDLPTGTTVLEASAGTGKTFTIAALVARYVAEGVATMGELLVVSFSRESTRELRERVRERLVQVRDGLACPQDVDPGDTVLAHLADAPADEVGRRHRRVQVALADFDAATVTTTHGFCQQVLAALGTAGDHDTSAQLVEDVSDLVLEVADDLYLRKWGVAGAGAPAMTVQDFRALALDVALRDPATALVPDLADADPATPHGLRARIARAVRDEVDLRKRRLHLFDYDDLLQRLDGTLRDEVTGEVAVQRLRERYQGGAGRRVPGHRPGAVVDPADSVPWPPHAGADRRPQAGDLRLPGRRRPRLPGGPAAGEHRAHPAHQLPQRRRAAARPRRAARRCRAG